MTRGPCGAGVDGESSSSVLVGCVRGVHGLRGWIRVQSHTRPVENILDYSPWQLRLEQGCVEAGVSLGRCHGCGIVGKLEGVEEREKRENKSFLESLEKSDRVKFTAYCPEEEASRALVAEAETLVKDTTPQKSDQLDSQTSTDESVI